LIEGRLCNYILDKGFPDFETYIQFALGDKTRKEIGVLVNKLTTNHTFFLRESQHDEFLAKTILPVVEKRALDKDLRIWSAGCSS
jgi:chemotaxis protein methyltransferase CheR